MTYRTESQKEPDSHRQEPEKRGTVLLSNLEEEQMSLGIPVGNANRAHPPPHLQPFLLHFL